VFVKRLHRLLYRILGVSWALCGLTGPRDLQCFSERMSLQCLAWNHCLIWAHPLSHCVLCRIRTPLQEVLLQVPNQANKSKHIERSIQGQAPKWACSRNNATCIFSEHFAFDKCISGLIAFLWLQCRRSWLSGVVFSGPLQTALWLSFKGRSVARELALFYFSKSFQRVFPAVGVGLAAWQALPTATFWQWMPAGTSRKISPR